MRKTLIAVVLSQFSTPAYADDTIKFLSEEQTLQSIQAYAYEANKNKELSIVHEQIDYVNQAETLLNLPGVYVFTDYIYAVNSSIKIEKSIPFLIEERLRKAGISVYSKKEIEKINGNPEIQFYLSATEGSQSCCLSIWMSLLQGASLVRDNRLRKKMGSWGAGEKSDCSTGRTDGDVREMVLRQVDKFILDYRAINKHLYEYPVEIEGHYSNDVYINSSQSEQAMSIEIVRTKDGDYAVIKQHINNNAIIPVVVPIYIAGLEVSFVVSSSKAHSSIVGNYSGTITRVGLTLQKSDTEGTHFLPRR